MLLNNYFEDVRFEAGLDEAGRGCLAGAVFAAAVIFPKDYENDEINDSKQLSRHERERLRLQIERDAVAFAIGTASEKEIDQINILNASILAMHRAVEALQVPPEALIVDGNRFKPYKSLPFKTIVKGDSKHLSIAAASILAKTCRDDYMLRLSGEYPQYQWHKNMGYPTKAHRQAIAQYGPSPYHRLSFRLLPSAETTP